MIINVTVHGARQGDFKGEGTGITNKDKIPGVGFSYGAVSPRDASSGLATGKVVQQPAVLTKEWGVSSPQFYSALFTNETLTSVVFEFMQANAQGVLFVNHTIQLTNATVSAMHEHVWISAPNLPPADQRNLQEISFVFQKIEISSTAGGTSVLGTWE
jgi:type VI secretion system secreted protein Hcp